MKQALLSAFILMSTCARLPKDASCISRCGLRSTENCAALQAYETRVLGAFDGLDWGTSSEVCALLAGWRVEAHIRKPSDFICEEGWFLDEGHFCVLGYTHTDRRTVEVFTADWDRSPLGHELVHALDFTSRGKVGHCKWQERGIKKALLEIQGRPDPSKSEEGCKL